MSAAPPAEGQALTAPRGSASSIIVRRTRVAMAASPRKLSAWSVSPLGENPVSLHNCQLPGGKSVMAF